MYYMLYTMKKEILTVRDVDEQEWRRFRARTAEEGLKTGDALTQAMKLWVKERESQRMKPDPKLLLKVKPITSEGRRSGGARKSTKRSMAQASDSPRFEPSYRVQDQERLSS